MDGVRSARSSKSMTASTLAARCSRFPPAQSLICDCQTGLLVSGRVREAAINLRSINFCLSATYPSHARLSRWLFCSGSSERCFPALVAQSSLVAGSQWWCVHARRQVRIRLVRFRSPFAALSCALVSIADIAGTMGRIWRASTR